MTFEEWESYQDQMLRYYNTHQYETMAEDDRFKDIEPSDLNEDDDDESPIVCLFHSCQFGDDLCLSRVGMKVYFKHPRFYDLKRKCLCDAYNILTGR